jgi:hypothetical protein
MKVTKLALLAWGSVFAVNAALAQGAAAPPARPAAPSDHAKKDIARHRAMAAAHEAAAKCLEAGEKEEACQKKLLDMCKGLAIGKHCGMRHEH